MNGQEARQAIEKRAYEIWQSNGSQHGRDKEFWLTAEKEVAGSSQQPVITAPPIFNTEKTPVSMNNSAEQQSAKKQSKKAGRKAKTVDAGLE